MRMSSPSETSPCKQTKQTNSPSSPSSDSASPCTCSSTSTASSGCNPRASRMLLMLLCTRCTSSAFEPLLVSPWLPKIVFRLAMVHCPFMAQIPLVCLSNLSTSCKTPWVTAPHRRCKRSSALANCWIYDIGGGRGGGGGSGTAKDVVVSQRATFRGRGGAGGGGRAKEVAQGALLWCLKIFGVVSLGVSN